MSTSNTILMRQAREALKGKWGLAVAANLVFVIVFFAVNFVPLLSFLVQLIVFGPLYLGLAIFSLSLARRQTAQVSLIFEGFKRFLDSLIAFVVVNLGFLLWGLVTMAPLIVSLLVMVGLSLPLFPEYQRYLAELLTASIVLIFIFCLWALVNFIAQIYVMLSIALTFYLLADHPEINGWDALGHSFRLMKGRRWKLLGLSLRFTGWFLLGLIPFGIGVLWVLPYLEISLALFYDDATEHQGTAAETGVRPQPLTPRPPAPRTTPPAPEKGSPGPSIVPESPPPPLHPRTRLCLSCHHPVTDPQAQACPKCGFPLMEVPRTEPKPGSAVTGPPPVPPSPAMPPVPPLRPPQAGPSRFPAPPLPLDLEATVMIGIPRLTSLSGEGRIETFELRRPLQKIGRNSDNDLVFSEEKTISGRHCEIYREGKEYYIKDLGSTNGVLVNHLRVEASVLKEGDEIKLGNKIFKFSYK